MTACAGDTFESLAMQKQTLRRQLRKRRQSLTPRQRRWASRRCTQKALAHPTLRGASRVGVYLHHGAELATDGLISALQQRGVQVYVPVSAAQGQMTWIRLYRHSPLKKGRYGITVPRLKCPRALISSLQLLVVPLVGVDRSLQRLGAGGGYYDRLRQNPQQHPRWMGWAYAEQCVAPLPREPWDRALNILITDRRPQWPTG